MMRTVHNFLDMVGMKNWWGRCQLANLHEWAHPRHLWSSLALAVSVFYLFLATEEATWAFLRFSS